MQLLTKYTRILNLKFNFQKKSQRLNIKIKATGKLVVIGQILIAVTHHDIHAFPDGLAGLRLELQWLQIGKHCRSLTKLTILTSSSARSKNFSKILITEKMRRLSAFLQKGYSYCRDGVRNSSSSSKAYLQHGEDDVAKLQKGQKTGANTKAKLSAYFTWKTEKQILS